MTVKKVHLILFMGQSNMAGRGDEKEAPDVPEGMGFEFRPVTAPDRLYPLKEPFGKDENDILGVYEPGMKTGSMVSAFVNAYVEETKTPVVGVSCSKGGSAIDQWLPGTPYYEDAVRRMKRCEAWLLAQGIEIERRLMAWCQGCTDGDLHTDSEVYRQHTACMLHAFMKECGVETCFLIQIGNHRDDPQLYVPIQEAQQKLADEEEHIILVSRQFADFARLGLMKDEFHYCQKGYNLVGEEAGRTAGQYIAAETNQAGKNTFILTRNVVVETAPEIANEPVKRAVSRFYRDLSMVLEPPDKEEGRAGNIYLRKGCFPAEEFHISVKNSKDMEIAASEELGFIYGLLYISEHCLGILPFWFWNDQKFEKKRQIAIPFTRYDSEKRPVAYRGWFINDEVLISRWKAGKSEEYPWEMALEALLRCGGNTVIPGTDSNSKKYAGLAGNMGLWVTQHHAEPLGAEMFLRAYPDKEPSFKKYPHLFRELWVEGIKRQMNHKIIWNLGFRGQGDTPFWENDPQYDTPEKRGRLISSIMKEQYDLVRQYVFDPVFSANLYGETMELYQQGLISLPEDVIMIWADNGYGKMVSRRQGNHNPRIPALPDPGLKGRRHGVYYHVSFYDLQAANVLTMMPNSMDFVKKELTSGYDRGITALWLVNCSNVKPHVYPLDFAAALWNRLDTEPEEHLEQYVCNYYGNGFLGEMKECFKEYFRAVLPYGEREDEHAGEQFYNYVTRILAHHWIKDGGKAACEELKWCGPAGTFSEQVTWFALKCETAYPGFKRLLDRCASLARELKEDGSRLWKDSLLLQVKLHACCLEGVQHFGKAYSAYENSDYFMAFYEAGRAADCFDQGQAAMEECCHGKWTGFYDNDCQTDIKETAYLLRLLMGYIRNLGDGPYFYQWQRRVIYPEKDRKIMLLLNYENHLTDEELYRAMREKE